MVIIWVTEVQIKSCSIFFLQIISATKKHGRIIVRVEILDKFLRAAVQCAWVLNPISMSKMLRAMVISTQNLKWKVKSDKSERMEIKKLKKALEEKEASAGGFDGFDNSNGGRMRIATITAVARAFNNASRRRPPCQPPLGESSLFKQCHFCRSKIFLDSFRLYGS